MYILKIRKEESYVWEKKDNTHLTIKSYKIKILDIYLGERHFNQNQNNWLHIIKNYNK